MCFFHKFLVIIRIDFKSARDMKKVLKIFSLSLTHFPLNQLFLDLICIILYFIIYNALTDTKLTAILIYVETNISIL